MKVIGRTLLVFSHACVDRDYRRALANERPPAARRWRWLLWMTIGGASLYVLLVHTALAADAYIGSGHGEFTLFDSVVNSANTTTQGWFTTIQGLVRPTFLILATIEICWAAALWAFEKDNLNSLAVEIIKKIMFIGFFYALLQFAPQWIPTITQTFETVGTTAGNIGTVSTDGIIADGLAIIDLIWQHAPKGFFSVLSHLGQILVACFVTVGVLIAFVVLAAQYFTLKVESYILFAAGAIFLGLGSSSWTKEYVSKYLNYAMNVGVRLLVMILVIALMVDTVQQMGNGFKFDYGPLLKLLGISILECILGIKAPEMAGALMNGGVGLSAGSARGAVGSAVGGVGTALGMATGAVGMAGGALKTAVRAGQGAASFGSGVKAGSDLAKQQGKTGAAATLSGLGAAVRATAKELPTSMTNAIKGKGDGAAGMGGGRGQNSGPIDRAAGALRGLAEAGAGAAAVGFGGAAGGSGGGGGAGGGGGGGPGGAVSGLGALSAGEAGKSLAAQTLAAAALATGLSESDSGSAAHSGGGSPPPYESPPSYSEDLHSGEMSLDSTPISSSGTSPSPSGATGPTSGARGPLPLGPRAMPGGTSPLSTLKKATASPPTPKDT